MQINRCTLWFKPVFGQYFAVAPISGPQVALVYRTSLGRVP